MKTDPFVGTITRFYDRAEQLVLGWSGDRDDLHHSVCCTLCDEFECWEVEVSGTRDLDPSESQMIPMWVMYIVGGIMRDNGI